MQASLPYLQEQCNAAIGLYFHIVIKRAKSSLHFVKWHTKHHQYREECLGYQSKLIAIVVPFYLARVFLVLLGHLTQKKTV